MVRDLCIPSTLRLYIYYDSGLRQGALAQSNVTVVSERGEREEPGRITEASSREQMLLLELQHGLSMVHHDYRRDIEKVNEVGR